MCYTNSLLARGLVRAVGTMAQRGVSGLIVPDMPAAEAGELRAVCDESGIALIPLVAPTTPADEVRRIAESARGFVYVVSVTGVTGERAALPPELGDVVERVREAADVPVAVGFRGRHAGAGRCRRSEIADGVIVGSRLVRGVMDAPTAADGLADVRAFLSDSVRAL